MFSTDQSVFTLDLGNRVSIEFFDLGASSSRHRVGDSSRWSNFAISGVGFLHQNWSCHYDKRHYLTSDVGVVQSSCGNAQLGWIGDRGFGGDI